MDRKYAINLWFSSVEETLIKLSGSHKTLAEPLCRFFDLQIKVETMRNKSIFVIFQPRMNDSL
ncbi:hypothetical protein N7493_000947 [Penicillium malachiteum]|uniref:Uncharacterized protein n=1 Tax=Penicillium malachiteum TaxID=1324776 RepID=A0AAD6HXC9_9EURO|nr:hypothetical protein N7493_000947 [Penicillium malachiteum]